MGRWRGEVNTYRKCLAFLAIAIASTYPVDSATAESSVDVFDEVVVTVQKRTEDLRSTAASVSVASGELMRQMAVRNSTQLEEFIPNLTVQSSRPNQSFAVIRGIGSPVEGLGVDQGVAVYVDGIQIDTPVANLFSVLDLEQVEVLRGPQGTLYGRNAVGGVINLISRRPGQEFNGRLLAGIGNYGFREIGVSVEGGIVPEVLAGRIGVVSHENSSSYFRNNAYQFIGENVADNGALESATVRGLLDFEPAANLRAVLSVDYTSTDTSGPATQPLGDVNALAKTMALDGLLLPIYSEDDGGVYALAHNLETLNYSRVYGAGLIINYYPGDRVELVSITGYRDSDLRLLEDLDASPHRYLEVASQATARSVSQELRFQYSGERLEGVIGLFFGDARYRDQFSVDVAAEFITVVGGSEPAITQRGSETTALAVFSQWDWGLTERLKLTFGGRWSDSEKTSFRREFLFSDLERSAVAAGRERCFVLGPGVGPQDQPNCLTTLSIPGQGDVPLPPTVAEAAGEGSWSQFSPKLVVQLALNEGVMAYASYSQGYRDGGLEGVAANFREFDKEILHAYEVGIKSDLAGSRLRANGAFFFYDYEDVQLELAQLRNNVVSRSVFNAGEAQVTGAELETTWQASDHLQVSLNVGWLKTEITEFDRDDLTVDPGFLKAGNELARAPEWTASFVPVFDFQLANGSVTWRSEINYKDEFYRDVENGGFADEEDALLLTGANIYDGVPLPEAIVTPGTLVYDERMDSRLVVNSVISFLSADQRLELSLWARNLSGGEYITDGDFVNGLGYTKVVYAAPRTYGLQVSFRY